MKNLVRLYLLISLFCLMLFTSSCEDNLSSTANCNNGGMSYNELRDGYTSADGVNCLEITTEKTRHKHTWITTKAL